jgi:hypothetical protein
VPKQGRIVDLTQHLGVISRWRKVLIASAVLGILLAVLFTMKPGGSGVTWRHDAKWESTSRLFVTQTGFPWGRTTLPDGTTDPTLNSTLDGKKAVAPTDPNDPKYADPGRLSLLAIIYSFISQSNTLKEINQKPLPEGSEVTAVELSNQNEGVLPLFQLTATAPTEKAATALNVERTNALTSYLAQQQDANDIPPGQRVKIAVLNKPFATKVSGHGEMLGVAMLFLALAGGVAACYLLESLRLSRERHASAAGNGEVVEHLSFTNSPSLSDKPKRSLR